MILNNCTYRIIDPIIVLWWHAESHSFLRRLVVAIAENGMRLSEVAYKAPYEPMDTV